MYLPFIFKLQFLFLVILPQYFYQKFINTFPGIIIHITLVLFFRLVGNMIQNFIDIKSPQYLRRNCILILVSFSIFINKLGLKNRKRVQDKIYLMLQKGKYFSLKYMFYFTSTVKQTISKSPTLLYSVIKIAKNSTSNRKATLSIGNTCSLNQTMELIH